MLVARYKSLPVAVILLVAWMASGLAGCGDKAKKAATGERPIAKASANNQSVPDRPRSGGTNENPNDQAAEEISTRTETKSVTKPTDMPKPTPAGKETGLIPRELLFGNPDKAAARISPDGKRLSYLAPVDGVLNVWVGPIDDPDAAKPVTKDKVRGIRSYFWAYTNKHILYTQDAEGDEDWHVYRVDLDTQETTDLTPLKKVRAEIEEVSYRFPNEILIGLNDRDPEFHDIYRMNLATGEKQLVQKNEEFAGFITDEDYRIRFASKLTPDGGNQIYKPTGKEGDAAWEEFLKIPADDMMTTSPVGFDKSGDVMYLMDSRGRDTGALVDLDLKTDEKELVAANPLCRRGRNHGPSDRKHDPGRFVHLHAHGVGIQGQGVAEDFQVTQDRGGRRHHDRQPHPG